MKYLVFIVAIVLFGCKHAPKKIAAVKNAAPVLEERFRLKALTSKRGEKDSIRLETEREEKLDSLRQIKLLDTAMKFAIKHQHDNFYTKNLTINDGLGASATLKFGFLFSKEKRHLILKTKSAWDLHLRVLYLDRNKFKEVIHTVIWDLNYVADTVRDVNGDGYKDFISTTYYSAGCCARNRDEVRLYLPGDGNFSGSYTFINPSYSPNEKFIRGVDYGHPGEVPLYKYKWNGLKIDTVEYIYPADTLKKNFYIVKRYGDENDPTKRRVINSIPKEYRKMYGYNWFIDY
ncbi:S8/S53 family peptidase [Mucilaginibacter segetis]|uniref:Uncharacterized protein n=1 Tax=Mucilaginibacter segetis TaxID=2793071 RepID=A0A934PUG3_9SPHI|nr:hypothetical protein [Mucilaginibacter segetis]MBK0379797.1 hypothetical protein [Mucilaginibacter segetis]